MKKLEQHIAWRYLFSKKGHNAINIVSCVSAVSVAVVTAVIVCVLSIMNGFGALVEKMFSEFDPPILVTAADGHAFKMDSTPVATLFQLHEIEYISQQVDQIALVRYKDRQMPARILGVDSMFEKTADVNTIINDGFYSVYDGACERAVLGRGLAEQIGIKPQFTGALHLYAPKRIGNINQLRPDQSIVHETTIIAGTFAINQIEYDDQLMLVSISLARKLFEYDDKHVTALRIIPAKNVSVKEAKQKIKDTLGPGFKVADRYEQQAEFFNILRIEKFLTVLLMAFILLIASFNIIGSLSMLIIDKQENIKILSHLGADQLTIQRIFRRVGWLISMLGAVSGLLFGLLLCLGQQHFGWLKLGNGDNYIVSTYPVLVQPTDILIVMGIVMVLGLISAWVPTHKLKIK